MIAINCANKMCSEYINILVVRALIVIFGICQAAQGSMPNEEVTNCKHIIDVNFSSKETNISRLKGQYVLVENCEGEKCKDHPFLNEGSTFYEHQCNEFNKIYLIWFENDSRYEFRKKGEYASIARLHDCKTPCPYQCSNLSAEVVFQFDTTKKLVDMAIGFSSATQKDMDDYKIKLEESEHYGSIQTILIVVLFLLLCISGGFNVYYKNKLQGDGLLPGLCPVIGNRLRCAEDDEEEPEGITYGGRGTQEKAKLREKSKKSKKKD